MNRKDHLLTIFSEECSEVIHATCKILRFGLEEGRDIDRTNHQRLREEFNQLLAMADMLSAEGIDLRNDLEIQQKKKDKVEEYLKYSEELGRYIPASSEYIEGMRVLTKEDMEDFFTTIHDMINKRVVQDIE